jgi:hypothetical protein
MTAIVLVGGPADGQEFELADPAPAWFRIRAPFEPAAWRNSTAELPSVIPLEIATYLRTGTLDPTTGRRRYVHA